MKTKYLIGLGLLAIAVVISAVVLWPQPEPEKTLTVVFTPGEWAELAVFEEEFGPIKEHLEKELGMECEFVLASDYAAAIEALRNETADITRTSIVQQVRVRGEIELKTIACEVLKGRDHYRCLLVGKPGIWQEPFTMDQLKGKTMALVDPGSQSGYLMPLTMMDEGGVSLDDLAEHSFTGSHPISVEALINGAVDVIGISDNVLAEAVEAGTAVEGENFVVLQQSPKLMGDVWVTGPSVPPELHERIKSAFLGMTEGDLEDSAIDGFSEVPADAHDIIEKMLEVLEEIEQK